MHRTIPVPDRARLGPAARNGAILVLGSLALWLSAKVQVPFYPVPMTLQTAVVLALGLTVGWRLAGLAVVLYLAEGLAGLPVFAGTPERGLGLAYLMGPTGGFLLGFVPGAVLAGWLAHRSNRGLRGTLGACLAGTAAIYAVGVAWLAALVGPATAVSAGVVPFLPGEAVKIALVVALAAACTRLTRRG